VSKSTVENYRNSLSVQNGQINPERIATRNGSTYTINTANIGGRRLRCGVLCGFLRAKENAPHPAYG
jgi:hypothetical protein